MLSLLIDHGERHHHTILKTLGHPASSNTDISKDGIRLLEFCVIVVKDEYGLILHQETISGVNITRKYQLNTEELEGVDVTFEVIGTKSTQSTVFSIKNNTRVVSETAIVKL